jgi:hypothetical protein
MSSEPFVRDNPMSFDLELNQRRTLVTGGTKGIGAAVVDVLRLLLNTFALPSTMPLR